MKNRRVLMNAATRQKKNKNNFNPPRKKQAKNQHLAWPSEEDFFLSDRRNFFECKNRYFHAKISPARFGLSSAKWFFLRKNCFFSPKTVSRQQFQGKNFRRVKTLFHHPEKRKVFAQNTSTRKKVRLAVWRFATIMFINKFIKNLIATKNRPLGESVKSFHEKQRRIF